VALVQRLQGVDAATGGGGRRARPATRHVGPPLRRRAGWGLADQALSSLTNAGLSILVARAVSSSSFGVFSITFALFSFLVGVSRCVSTEPLVVRFSETTTERWRIAVRQATGMAVMVGVTAGVLTGGLGLAIGGEFGTALQALAIVLPALLLQDAWRYAFFAAGRPAAATVNDLAWAVLQFSSLAVFLMQGRTMVPVLILAWGGSAGGAAVLGYFQSRAWPTPRRAADWARGSRAIAGFKLSDFLVTMGTFNLALILIGFVGDVADVGALRAAHVLLGPLWMLHQGLGVVALPEFARRRHGGARTLLVDSAVVSIGGVGLGVLWVSLLLLVPADWGTAVLGESWEAGRETLLPYAVMTLGVLIAVGAELMLRAQSQHRRVVQVSLVCAPLTLVFGVAGALMAQAPGAAAGFALSHLIAAAGMWRALWSTVRPESARRHPIREEQA
jgi:O-antigen/teichoic acid export membrane protein